MGMIKMKCELKYVTHEYIRAYKETSWKELLVVIPVSILIVFVLNWLIGITYTHIVAFVFVCYFLCMMFKDGIKYCKNRMG